MTKNFTKKQNQKKLKSKSPKQYTYEKKIDLGKDWVVRNNGKIMYRGIKRGLRGNALEKYKTTLALTDFQKEILIAILLGDAFFTFKRKAKDPCYSLVFAQKEASKDYVAHIYEIFKPFVGMPPQINPISGIKPGKPKRYEVRFTTYNHPAFKIYYDLFYPFTTKNEKRVKLVPKNIGSLLITHEAR
jgi:LAGLIDADG DNA endonuclease family